MQPPSKRRRLAGNSYSNINLHARRAQNDLRLKSIFESIFDKYGKDFDGIGDEIDLETGEIVVNNGHLQGMTNERDTGDPQYSSKRLGDPNNEDDQPLIQYSGDDIATSGLSKAGDAAVIEESDASEQSDFVADSLVGDVSDSSLLHKFGENSMTEVAIPSDDEEDELASSDIEWTSQHKGRMGVQERFGILKDNVAFVDEPAIDPVWRAPSLPNITRLEGEREELGVTSIDDMREYSDDEQAGISLWTPEVRKCPVRRRAKTNSISQPSLSFVRGQENNADEILSDSSDSEPAPEPRVKWTQEEDELLTHLKMTTNLSCASMKCYFPKRQQNNAIASHWTYMVNRGKANPKSQVSTILGRREHPSSLPSSTDPITTEGTRSKPHGSSTTSETKEPRNVQLQTNGGKQEVGSFMPSSSEPVAEIGDHHISSSYQVSSDYRILADVSVSIPDDAGASVRYSTGEPLLSAKDCRCSIAKSANQVNSNGCHADTDQSYNASKPFEIEDESSVPGKDRGSNFPDQVSRVVSKDGRRGQGRSASTSINAKPDSKGVEPSSGGIVSPEIHFPSATAIEATNSPRQDRISKSETQREKSISPTVENTIRRKESTPPELPKTWCRTLSSTTPAQPPNRGNSSASSGRNIDVKGTDFNRRQIVQVVIPLAPSSKPQFRFPLATTETEDPASISQISATMESTSATSGSSLTQQEDLAIRPPTSSPSATAAESQYAAFVHDGNKNSLGPEIADSQPLSSMPGLGEDPSRPIVLDAESPHLRMSPGVAPSTGKHLREATKRIFLECSPQSLRATSGIATPARKRIEEATESDILESGSHPLGAPPSVARSLSKRAKKGTNANSSSNIWTAIDNYSEDELSYL